MSHKWYQGHSWLAVATHAGVSLKSNGWGDSKKIMITIVLYACECGKHKTKTFDGHWTLNDVLLRDTAANIGAKS